MIITEKHIETRYKPEDNLTKEKLGKYLKIVTLLEKN